jgi:nucleoside-diphosphate-sugar epimerase
MREILVTGGAGFIGSHTCVALIKAGFRVIILDNFCNSENSAVDRIETIASVRPELIKGDVRDRSLLREVFATYPIDGVIHFAALKALGQSVRMPLEYFDCNVAGTLTLLQEMRTSGIKVFVFSSTAAVYGEVAQTPVEESFPRFGTNPYARSKIIVEEMLNDLYCADCSWRIAKLRYFNAVGAAEAIARALNPDAPNAWELGGPRVYTYRELLAEIAARLGKRPLLVSVPFTLWHLLARIPGLPSVAIKLNSWKPTRLIPRRCPGSTPLAWCHSLSQIRSKRSLPQLDDRAAGSGRAPSHRIPAGAIPAALSKTPAQAGSKKGSC